MTNQEEKIGGKLKPKEKAVADKKTATVDAVRKYVDQLAKVNPFEDFRKLENQKNTKPCMKWETVGKKKGAKCLDGNLVKLEDTKIFINAATIQNSSFCLGKLPKLDDTDECRLFWLMMSELKANAHLIVAEDEVENLAKLFSLRTSEVASLESVVQYQGLTVNTRCVEKDFAKNGSDVSQFIVEIMVEGQSESHFSKIYVHCGWKKGYALSDLTHIWGSAQLVNQSSIEPSDGRHINVVLCSGHGSGRNATVLSLACGIQMLEDGRVPDLLHIVESLRSDRPGAVETPMQYASLYLAVNSYAMKAISGDSSAQRVYKACAAFGDRVAAIARQSPGMLLEKAPK